MNNKAVVIAVILALWGITSARSATPRVTEVNSSRSTGQQNDLFSAVKAGDLNQVRAFVAQGVDINDGGEDGVTPLMVAAMWKQNQVAKLLLAEGAEVNLKNKKGQSAVMYAARVDNKELVELLKKAGATYTDSLSYAAARGDADAVQSFLSGGTGINSKNDFGETALFESGAAGNVKMVKFLIEKGADVNLANDDGGTILRFAARKGQVAESCGVRGVTS